MECGIWYLQKVQLVPEQCMKKDGVLLHFQQGCLVSACRGDSLQIFSYLFLMQCCTIIKWFVVWVAKSCSNHPGPLS